MTDKEYIQSAIKLATQSSEPVGCGVVIVQNGRVIARAFNSQRVDKMAINHAEVKAIIIANSKWKSRKLAHAVAYCSCEPCMMCLVALSYANVERIVFHHKMAELFPDDPQSQLDSQQFVSQLNFVPKLEQLALS